MENLSDLRKNDAFQPPPDEPPIRVGISSCLLGMEVRYDGGHKHDSFLTQTLGRYFTWISVCPEVEMGMGVPRENIRLVGTAANPRLIGAKSGTDYSEKMKTYARQRLEKLAQLELHAYILKKDSPSCGMERVRVYGPNEIPTRDGVGMYARALMEKFPLLPIEEEGRLNDPRLRENFIERVFAYYRLTEFLKNHPRPADLVKFHTRHKLTLMSHSPKHYRELGRLVARAGQANFQASLEEYATQFMAGLKINATPRKHANVLYHVMGYFKKTLDSADRQELATLIEQYRQQLIPLIVPITLVKHHLRRHPVPWMEEQVYLNPYPGELMLRNFV